MAILSYFVIFLVAVTGVVIAASIASMKMSYERKEVERNRMYR